MLIVADDLGHGDLSSYGGDVPTPRIDSIASGGVRFTDGYVTAPVCNPSRAGLMTGRYQQRWGQEMNNQSEPPEGAPRASLPRTETTLAAELKSRGYATAAIGKWHLGMDAGYHPLDRGFDQFFGLANGVRYVDPSWPGVHIFGGTEAFDSAEPPLNEAEFYARATVIRGRQPAKLEEYLTDQLASEGIEFIERHREHPFFLYLAFNAPHGPLEVTDEYYQRFPQFKDERKRINAAMLSALDDGIGRVLDKLDEIGAAENTLVVFVSDNGAPEYEDADGRRNAPFTGHKRNLYEGGIRVPFMLRWPGRVPAGKTYPEMVSTLDLMPTLLAASGQEEPPAAAATAQPPASGESRPGAALDGTDLLPFVSGARSGPPHDVLFWRTGPNGAVRQGQWKLLLAGDVVRLYDLAKDPAEEHDLSAENRALVDELRAAWSRWNAELAPSRVSQRSSSTSHAGDSIRWMI
jgi:arylsulfatase A-like enzyme